MAKRFIEVTGLSDVGSVRQYNEDSIAYDAQIGALALADGMGGHRSGEVASRMATEVIMQRLEKQVPALPADSGKQLVAKVLKKSVSRANQAILQESQANPDHAGMGTTLAAALFFDNHVSLAHVGDSRVYRLRDRKLTLLTRDDSLLREQVELGVISANDAKASHNRSLITRGLGSGDHPGTHLRTDSAHLGDVYLICSDGLSDMIDDTDIEAVLQALHSNLPLAANILVQSAKDAGGFDNVSVILAKVVAPFPATSSQGWFRRLLARFR